MCSSGGGCGSLRYTSAARDEEATVDTGHVKQARDRSLDHFGLCLIVVRIGQ